MTRVWMTAALTRAKKLPELSKLLNKKAEGKADVAAKLRTALSGIKGKTKG